MTPTPPTGCGPEYMAWVERHTGRSLPTIITGPGQYRTRSGKRVIIDQHQRDTVSTFKVSGTIVHREKPRKIEWQIWKPNGQVRILGESPLDIVGLWCE